MNRFEAWLIHLSNLTVAITGLVYAWMHYLMKPVDPFSVVNHPLEPYMLKLHIVIAPLLIFAIGLIVHSHIVIKLINGARTGRRSGVLMIFLFVFMVFSGYLLQVFTAPAIHKSFFVIHLASGSAWFLSYLSHQVAAIRMKRSMALRNNA